MINKQFNRALFILFATIGFASFLPTSNTLALQSYDKMSSSDQALSHSYYKSIHTCISNSAIDRDIDEGKANDPPQWVNDSLFGINPQVNTGYLIDDGKDKNGTAYCRDIIGRALSFWQVSGTDFLKGVGYTLKADGTQWNAPRSGLIDKYSSFISTATSTKLTDAIEYELALAALTADKDGCSATKIGLFKDQSESVQRMATSNTNGYFILRSPVGDSSVSSHIFKRDGNQSTMYSYKPGELKGGSTPCEQIIARANELAPKIAQATANRLYNELSNKLYGSLATIRNAECNKNPNRAIIQECQDAWQNTFNKCFAKIKTSAPGQNFADGSNSPSYVLPSKERLEELAVCIATGTGASVKDIIAALVGAAATIPPPPASDVAGNVSASTDMAPACGIEAVGWIICPVMRFMSQIVDQAYGAISAMLTTPAIDTSTTNSNPLYKAWSYMRNFANVAFVIAFLIIIFSQLTSVGLNNYGIKKMLPRLIVAAILVNVSYWICVIAVDISNILGFSLKSLMDVGGTSLYNDSGTAKSGAGGGWDVLTVGLIAGVGGATVLYLGLSILFPMLIAALAAIVTVVLVLTMRQALIIVLIVISPLAFVAYLLPNTEKWFNKWRELFQVLLLMFPIIAVIFGGSALAATIISNVANDSKEPNFVLQVMAAGITIIPLFIVPVVMKTAGGVLNRFGGMVNNPNKGPFDRLRKGAARIREDQEGKRSIRAMNGGQVFGRGRFQRQAKRDAVSQGIKSELGRAKSQFIAEELGSNESFRNQVAGGSRGAYTPNADPAAMQRALAGAKFTIDNAVAENIKAEAIIVRDFNADQLKGVLANSNTSEEQKAAAMQRLVKISDPGDSVDKDGKVTKGYASDVNAAMGGSEVLRRATADALAANGPGFLKAGDIDKIATGSHKTDTGARSTLQSIAKSNTANGVYSQEKMVDDTEGNLEFAFQSADNEGKQLMVNTAAALKKNPVLQGKIKHNAKAVDNLSVAQNPSYRKPTP